MKKTAFATLAAAALLFTGCFNTEAPKCSDKDVTSLLKKTYTQWRESMEKSGNPLMAVYSVMLPQKIVTIDAPRASAYDPNIKLRSCKAEVTFDNNITGTLAYTVQIDEKNSDQFYLELDSDSLTALLQQSLMGNMLKQLDK